MRSLSTPKDQREPGEEAGASRFLLFFLSILASLLLFFIVAPLVRLTLSTSTGSLASALADREVRQSLWLTLRAAAFATFVSVFLGVPLAYLLARTRFPGRAVVQGLVDLPIMVPHAAAGIALLTIIGRDSLIQRLASPFALRFVGEELGIAMAMAYVSVPFLVNAAREGFEAIPERLEKVARTLGASPWRVFLTISLSMSWRAILSGMTLMWGRGISEFGAVIIIAYHPMTAPILVFQRFTDFGLAFARPVAVLLILVCVAGFAALRFISRSTQADRYGP
ncbi:MAG: ABC transporter permease subunit [Acidobacteria bacterium]|nr:MAG: ABC transporter permease subunit [Acidobacteriota bacterium]